MPEERKLVSLVFADVVGSTAWGAQHDPEFVRGSMARYFARMKRDLDAAQIPNDGIHDEPALNAKGLVFYDPDGIAVELYAIQR